jgi:hypothetical protein
MPKKFYFNTDNDDRDLDPQGRSLTARIQLAGKLYRCLASC